jgi:hypothetical protein
VAKLVIDFDENRFRRIASKTARDFGLPEGIAEIVIEKVLSAIRSSSRPVRF